MLNRLKSLLAAICAIIIVFVAVSLFDILLAVFYPRFYSTMAFIVTFGAGGVFASVFAYQCGIGMSAGPDETDRRMLIAFIIILGLILFFFLAKPGGGEYEAPFKAFGASLALGSLLFVKGKVEQ